MESETAAPHDEEITLKEKFLALLFVAPYLLMPAALTVYWSFLLAPLHWSLIHRMGPNGLWLQFSILAFLVELWTRVPPMPGLMQGVICIGGWFTLAGAVLSWIPFALGVLAGFNSF